jgi:hypothetical protein
MTVLVEVRDVTADECGCDYRSNPAAHDYLLAMPSLPSLQACIVICQKNQRAPEATRGQPLDTDLAIGRG